MAHGAGAWRVARDMHAPSPRITHHALFSVLCPVIIGVLGLVFFGQLVLHPAQVLYSDYSDLLAEHIPAKRFLVRAWQETGEVPLWCPYSFSGAPFIGDIQVGAFYPPHLPLYLLPEEWIGPAVSWLIVLHLLTAGWCMYVYARSHLERLGALTAALGYMFAGKWLLHLLGAGHYITVGLAWLPLVLLFLEQASERRSLFRATWAGIFFAFIVLGTHPQWTLYAGILIALWTLATAVSGCQKMGMVQRGVAVSPGLPAPSPQPLSPATGERGKGAESQPFSPAAGARGRGEGVGTRVNRWLGYGAWCLLIAVGLTAVQLLPTWQASTQSGRSAGVDASEIIRGGGQALLFLIGPGLDAKLHPPMWEIAGGLPLLWLVAAVLAPVLVRGRVRYQAGVCLALFLFAIGGALIFQPLPVFNLFRQPARMLVVVTLPMAFLAGAATQALFAKVPMTVAEVKQCRGILLRILVGALILVGGFAIRLYLASKYNKEFRVHGYWFTLLVTVPVAYWLLGRSINRKGTPSCPPLFPAIWLTVLVVDLWAFAWPLVAVRPEGEVYATSACVRYVADNAVKAHDRVLDRDLPPARTPLGAGAPLAMLHGIEPLRGYNPLDVLRYKEYLQLVADSDQPLRPLEGTLMFPVIGNFPIANKSLLDLLGTRYLMQPSAEPVEQAGWRKVFDDPAPVGYDFILGGMQKLPGYTVYENPEAFARAFIVTQAEPLPERPHVLEKLRQTDFHKVVLLEAVGSGEWGVGSETVLHQGAYAPRSPTLHSPLPTPHSPLSTPRAEITTYQPNRIIIQAQTDTPGYLVLADVWYPGWTCTVDDEPVPVYRADFLFRAVPLTTGKHEVVFRFAPRSYALGKIISSASLLFVVILFAAGVILHWLRRSRVRSA